MSFRIALLTAAASAIWMGSHDSAAYAQAGRSFPLVYGATGRPYGPTQAHYQYMRQYGRPWSGPDGSGSVIQLGGVNGVPAGTHYRAGTFDYVTYAPFETYPFSGMMGVTVMPIIPFGGFHGMPPVIVSPGMTTWGPLGPAVPQLQPIPPDPNFPDPMQPGFGGAHFHAPDRPQAPVIEPSTPQAQQLSVRYQAQGDEQLRLLNYLAASERYKKSIETAKDQAEPRYRLGVTMAARGRFDEAVHHLKLAVALDPEWAAAAVSLEELFGEPNTLEKTRVKQRVAEWTHADVRDPDRLFLLGVLLFLDGDDRSRTLLETAVRVAGAEEHLIAFLAPQLKPLAAPDLETEQNNAPGGQPQPPLPPAPRVDTGPLLPPLPR